MNISNPGSSIPFTVNTTPVRALDTVYHNTGAKPRLVEVSYNMQTIAATPSSINVLCKVGLANPPDVVVCEDYITRDDASQLYGRSDRHSVAFVVPPGSYYKVEQSSVGGGSTAIAHWTEAD